MKRKNKESGIVPIILSVVAFLIVAVILDFFYTQTSYLPLRLVSALFIMMALINGILLLLGIISNNVILLAVVDLVFELLYSMTGLVLFRLISLICIVAIAVAVIVMLFKKRRKQNITPKETTEIEQPAGKKENISNTLKDKFNKSGDKAKEFLLKNRVMFAIILILTVLVSYQIFFFSMLNRMTSLLTLNYLHLVILLFVFVMLIAIEKWCKHTESKDKQLSAFLQNLRISSTICRIAVLLTSISLTVKLLGFYDTQKWLVYILCAIWIYSTVFIVFSLAARVVKNELFTNPKINIPVPFMGGDDNDLSILSYLEKNTGITMRSLWSMQIVKKMIPYSIVLCVALFWMATGIVQVESYQQGAVYHFGQLKSETLSPGLHFTFPWPFDKVLIYNTETVNKMTIGYSSQIETDNTWTATHGDNEYKLLLGGGDELVSINLRLEYNINDLQKYLTNNSSPEKLLEALAYEIVTDETINTDLESLLSLDRSAFAQEFKTKLVEKLNSYDTGLSVVSVVLESIHPPISVADIYQKIVSAEIESDKYILDAEATAAVTMADAQAKYDTSVNSANADYFTKVANAKADVASFMASVKADSASSDAYRYYKYLDALQSAYGNSKIVIVGEGVDSSNIYFGNTMLIN